MTPIDLVPVPAGDPTASAKPDKGAESDGWLRDNLEAVAVAIIMALLIRHFCVEAFRIPTSSMVPTLHGQSPERSGDRILVNKIGYYFGEPDRWHVVVFKYPLNRARNYIKRLIGKGGEEIDIRGGDIYVNGGIARKPVSVQSGLWSRVFTLERALDVAERNLKFEQDIRTHEGIDPSAKDRARTWAVSVGFRDGEDIARIVDGSLQADARGLKDTAWIAMPEKGGSGRWIAHDDRYNEIADLRLSATLTLMPGKSGALWLRVGPPDSRFFVRLPIGGPGKAAVWHSTDAIDDADGLGTQLELAPVVDIPAGVPVRFAIAHVDGAVMLRIDGVEVFRHEYEPPAASYAVAASWDGTPAIGLADAKMVCTALDVDRDIHYLRENPQRLPFRVPPGHYLMLGDNSGSSKDSRLWSSVEFDLTDGRTIRGDGDTNSRGDDGRAQYVLDPDRGTLEFVDETGRRWMLERSQVKNFDDPRTEVAPFVPEENLVGRAFFVFFPLGRISFIR